MNKYIVSSAVIIGFLLYAFRIHSEQEAAISSVTGYPAVEAQLYRDGTYIGDSVDAVYGNVQVETTITNGLITKIDFLQYPDHHQYSKSINPEALPQLGQEAIQVQNAEVNIYSGATQTSKAFKKSLQTALEKATL